MVQYLVNTQRFDPYKNMKFRVKWDGRYVAGVSKVSALKRSTEVLTHRDGIDPSTSRASPSLCMFEPITLERGISHDPEFKAWADKINSSEGDLAISLKSFRRDIIIELLNEAGQVAKAYKVFRCWVSAYQAMPEVDANAHAVAIEHMVIQNEGWERDVDTPDPAER